MTEPEQDLRNTLESFIEEYLLLCKDGNVCDEALQVDLLKLQEKTKKAFQIEMPSSVEPGN